MILELVVRTIMTALDRGLPDCTVRALHLPVRTGVVHIGETMLDVVVATDANKGLNRRTINKFPLAPLGNRLRIDPEFLCQSRQALFTTLYLSTGEPRRCVASM